MIITITNSCNTIFLLLLLTPLTQAQAQPSSPGDNTGPNYGNFNPSIGVIIIVLVAALFFMGFFTIYIRNCFDSSSTSPTRHRTIGSIGRSRRAPRGLDREVIESFPTFDYATVKSAKIGKGALECAVCLTEFEDDDTLRLIPKCDHVFHPDCIDAWLIGHTTCPVCRCNLSVDATSIGDDSNTNNNNNQASDDILVGDVNRLSQLDDVDHNNNNINTNNINVNVTHEGESMEQPLNGRISKNRTIRNLSFGRPRSWFEGTYSRSYSTGHVAVKQWEDVERFTLRLPEELRKQIMSGKLERSTSVVVLPRETSSRRGYRTGFGEGASSSRPSRFGGRVDRTGRSGRWVFSLAPPFINRAFSFKSPNKVGPILPTSQGGSIRENVGHILPTSRGGSIRENVGPILPKSRGGSIRENVVATNEEGSLRGNMQAELSQLPV